MGKLANKITTVNLITLLIFLSLYFNYSYAEDSAYQYRERGVTYGEQGLYDKAIEEFKKALEIDANDYRAYYWIGFSYSYKKMPDEAIAYYKKAIEIEPNFPNAYFDLGIDYSAKGLHEEAISIYEKAVTLNPMLIEPKFFSDVYFNLGGEYRKKNLLDKAISAYKKAIEINPKNDKPYVNLGIIYHDRQLFEEAISYYEKAIEIDPQHPTAYNNMGKSCSEYAVVLSNSADNTAYKEKIYSLVKRAVENFNKTIELSQNNEGDKTLQQSAQKGLDYLAQKGLVERTSEDGLDAALRKSVTGSVISYYLDADENNPDREVLKVVDIKNKKLLLQTERQYLVGHEVQLMSAIMANNLERTKEIIEQAKIEYYKKHKDIEPKEEIDLLSDKRYVNKKLGFSIIPLKDWGITEGEGYITISKPFDPFGSSVLIAISISPNKENLSLAEMKKEFIDKISKVPAIDKDYQIKILQDEEIIIAETPAYSCIYEVIDAGFVGSVKITGFIKEDKRYLIQYISEVSPYEFKKYLPVFEKSLASFKIE